MFVDAIGALQSRVKLMPQIADILEKRLLALILDKWKSGKFQW